jgi:hypothetical protein
VLSHVGTCDVSWRDDSGAWIQSVHGRRLDAGDGGDDSYGCIWKHGGVIMAKSSQSIKTLIDYRSFDCCSWLLVFYLGDATDEELDKPVTFSRKYLEFHNLVNEVYGWGSPVIFIRTLRKLSIEHAISFFTCLGQIVVDL